MAENKIPIRREGTGRRMTVRASLVRGLSVESQLQRALEDCRARVIDLFHDWDEDGDGSVSKK